LEFEQARHTRFCFGQSRKIRQKYRVEISKSGRHKRYDKDWNWVQVLNSLGRSVTRAWCVVGDSSSFRVDPRVYQRRATERGSYSDTPVDDPVTTQLCNMFYTARGKLREHRCRFYFYCLKAMRSSMQRTSRSYFGTATNINCSATI
jgi:hypothetical protein